MANITVSSAEGLASALKAAQGGDTILLASGDYSGLYLKGLNFSTDVTIASADPANKAVLGNFTVFSTSGLTFRDVEIEVTGTGTFGVNIYNSSQLTFDSVFVHGSLDGDAQNDAGGLGFINSSQITVKDSEFTQLRQAVGVGGPASDIVITDNNVHHLMKSGFVLAGASNVEITGNVISDIRPTGGAHPDAIQFFTTGTTESARNIVISENLITRGDGAATQGIFISDQTGKLPYENVTVANNMVVGTGYGGVFIDSVNGLVVSGNELVSNPGDVNRTTMLIQHSSHVTVTDNSAVKFGFDALVDFTQSSNTVTSAVTDLGTSAVQRWLASISGNAGVVDSPVGTEPDATLPPVTTLPDLQEPPFEATLPPVSTPAPGLSTDINVAKGALDAAGDALDNRITGTFNHNKLYGWDGNDTLDGQGGNDTLVGGAGDDVYIVPNSGSLIVEKAGEGIDTVIARGSHVLADHVENLQIETSVSNGWSGTGNELNNRLVGNSGDNLLSGLDGADTIIGGAGKDTLIGGSGDDYLIGGAGADTFSFTPGAGHDVIVDFGADGERDAIDVYAYIRAGIKSTIIDVGEDVLISFTNGDSITVQGVDPSALKPWFAGWIT